jgi:hypothetical protein
MTNDERMTKSEDQSARGNFFVIELVINSSLDIRHSSFVIRHFLHLWHNIFDHFERRAKLSDQELESPPAFGIKLWRGRQRSLS